MGRSRASWPVVGLAVGLCLLAGTSAGASPASSRDEQGVYSLAVIPRSPPAQTHRDWVPLTERLSRAVGARLVVRVYGDISDFESELVRGIPDFAFLNPYQQVVVGRRQGYRPLVREGRTMLTGILVVRHDSPIRTVEDLRGKTLAFPHPNAFGASLYLRALLRERFNIDFTPRYMNSHGNVYRHVLRGLTDGGGGVNITLGEEAPAARQQLRVLFETPAVAPHPLAAHPRVPAGLRSAVARALLRMADDADGRALLAAVHLPNPVAADHARDYAPLEKLRLEKYYVKSQISQP